MLGRCGAPLGAWWVGLGSEPGCANRCHQLALTCPSLQLYPAALPLLPASIKPALSGGLGKVCRTTLWLAQQSPPDCVHRMALRRHRGNISHSLSIKVSHHHRASSEMADSVKKAAHQMPGRPMLVLVGTLLHNLPQHARPQKLNPGSMVSPMIAWRSHKPAWAGQRKLARQVARTASVFSSVPSAPYGADLTLLMSSFVLTCTLVP